MRLEPRRGLPTAIFSTIGQRSTTSHLLGLEVTGQQESQFAGMAGAGLKEGKVAGNEVERVELVFDTPMPTLYDLMHEDNDST